jgi:HSP20 family protein
MNAIDQYKIPVALGHAPAPSRSTGNGSASSGAAASAAPSRPPRVPPTDIHETPEGLVLEADLPGATEQNLTIELNQNVLHLHGRIPGAVPEGACPLYEESPCGEFTRSFILSDEIERSQITAELKNGVLRLWLPRAQRARTRRIDIDTRAL